MNLASVTPSAMVLDARNVSFNPVDSPVSDLVIMAQADYYQALANNLIAGSLIGLGIACILFCVGLAIYSAIESSPERKRNKRRKQWRARMALHDSRRSFRSY